MTKSSKRTRGAKNVGTPLKGVELPSRVGLPTKDSVIGVTTIGPAATGDTAAALAAPAFRIFHTNELDEYEEGTASPAAAAAAAKKLPTGDKFLGKDRKAAKLSVAQAKIEPFKDVKTLIGSLAAEDKMINHNPKITRDAKSDRVKEEKRNIRVTAFIYAASREADNDFHLIVGRDPKKTPDLYMTMELSGLPDSNNPSLPALRSARDAFKTFFKDKLKNTLPGLAYDFYDPPLAVEIEGSLFFDVTHAEGSRPGPKSLKSRMPVIWEVHPITKMVFKS